MTKRNDQELICQTWVPKEIKIALDVAAEDTGMMKKDIIKDALEEWLIAHGYLEPYNRIAI